MEDCNDVKIGMMVKVVSLGSTRGMFIAQKHLDLRQKGKTGRVHGWVPGHGGDVWFVVQDDGIAAYSYVEIEPA